jgi:UDP-N-acetyl-D-glucosamine dehydrogenase
LAGEINDFMPEYVVQRLQDILNDNGKPLKGSKILVVGVTYKGDVADLRESPALKVIKNLEKKSAGVLFYDPLIEEFELDGKKYKRSDLTRELLESVDGVVITTAHTKGVDYQFIVDHAPFVYDTKNITKDIKKNREKIILL